ncbi:MAG: hypothetical protein GF313_07525 [Caldithrix sp.]|nr:hypothetical protein [Caldithrix sp.]
MDTFKFSILFISLIIIACKLDTTSVPAPPESKQMIPDAGKLHQIKVIQTDYDSLVVQNSDHLILKSKSVSAIRLYQKDSLVYTLRDTVVPKYTGRYGHYRPQFKLGINVGEDVLFYDFQIRYELFDSSIVAIDSSVTMCQYPYPSGEVYKLYDELPFPKHKDIAYIDDVDYKDGNFYYRVSGSYGIYLINDQTGREEPLVDYVSHNYITVDSIYLCYTDSPRSIRRQNLDTGNEKYIIYYDHYHDTTITGLESEQGYLYHTTRSNQLLLTYDYNGNFVKSQPYSELTFSLSKLFNKLYALKYTSAITIFNLTTGAFEESKPIPSRHTYAFCLSDDYLFYSDDKRRYIGRIPIEDFLTYE